jgi:hypothetical protein
LPSASGRESQETDHAAYHVGLPVNNREQQLPEYPAPGSSASDLTVNLSRFCINWHILLLLEVPPFDKIKTDAREHYGDGKRRY